MRRSFGERVTRAAALMIAVASALSGVPTTAAAAHDSSRFSLVTYHLRWMILYSIDAKEERQCGAIS